MSCMYLRRVFYRHLFPVGTRFHVVELCLDCGIIARGEGTWVAQSEVRDPAALPMAPDHKATTQQPSLFDTVVGGEGQS